MGVSINLLVRCVVPTAILLQDVFEMKFLDKQFLTDRKEVIMYSTVQKFEKVQMVLK